MASVDVGSLNFHLLISRASSGPHMGGVRKEALWRIKVITDTSSKEATSPSQSGIAVEE
jgi:hypothetical protein